MSRQAKSPTRWDGQGTTTGDHQVLIQELASDARPSSGSSLLEWRVRHYMYEPQLASYFTPKAMYLFCHIYEMQTKAYGIERNKFIG